MASILGPENPGWTNSGIVKIAASYCSTWVAKKSQTGMNGWDRSMWHRQTQVPFNGPPGRAGSAGPTAVGRG